MGYSRTDRRWASTIRPYFFPAFVFRIQHLEDMLYIYAKNNLVMVNVYIKDPVVTRIWRDEKTPIIHFVAYTGGLLGLCMGFSLVSLFEIIFYTLKGVPWGKWFKMEKMRYIHPMHCY